LLGIGRQPATLGGIEQWRVREGAHLLIVYAALIVSLYPTFYFFTRWIPGNLPDSLGLRFFSATVSASIAVACLVFPGSRRWMYRLQTVSVGVFFLTLFAIVVNAQNNAYYLVGELIGIFGAQYAFVRRRDLLWTYAAGFAFDVAFSAYRGQWSDGITLYAIGVAGTASAIAVVSGSMRIMAQTAEMQQRLRLEGQAARLNAQAGHIEHLAYFDMLTELPNRALMNERIDEAIAACERHGRCGALLYLDLDGFKEINDRFGHDAGDRVLKLAASRLRQVVRRNEVAARIGGDEFAVLLPDVATDLEPIDVARRIQQVFAEPFLMNGHDFTLTASIGSARFPQDGSTRNALLTCADAAMYAAKRQGHGFLHAY
jgi:diguanylate cyclase (GGDEF)-like protein